MQEKDLYLPVKNLLHQKIGCEAVYAEIMNIDVLGINNTANIIVEMKKNLSFKLIEQAYRGLKYAHYVYIAVPKSKTSYFFVYQNFLKPKGIGIIEVADLGRGDFEAYVTYPAKFNRIKKSNRDYIRSKIESYSANNVAGSKSGEVITKYGFMISVVKKYMRNRGWLSIDEILDNCETYYAQPKPSLSLALRKYEQDWCETKVINGKRYFKLKDSKEN